MSKQWTVSDITKLFFMQDGSKTPLLYAEEKGEIPKAERVNRGSKGIIKVRKWKTEDIPTIGAKFGFLSAPKEQIVIVVYTPKGGVLKTTLSANIARMLALNGIKTVAIGLDFQKSLSKYLIPRKPIQTIEDIPTKQELGLYHFLYENAPLSKVIKNTDLPTLDVIPETSDLNFMAKKMRVENRREYILKERLLPKLSNYQVVIFDCNPGWNELTENALVASKSILTAVACETECYEALKDNVEEITEFQKTMHLNWHDYYMIPTLLENNSISQNIYASYLNKYHGSIIPISIRRSVAGQEARLNNSSVIEYSPKSNLAQDYYDIVTNVWEKIIGAST